MYSRTKEGRAEYWKRYRLTKKPYVLKTCIVCGTEFKPTSGPQKRCNTCRALKCHTCGRLFVPPSGHYGQKYCSRKCKDASQRGEEPLHLRENRGRKKRTRRIHTCKVCGVHFEYYNYRNPSYCSKECWEKRGDKIEARCLYCNGPVVILSSVAKWNRGKYCSKRCYSLHQREIQLGEASHLWRGGATKKNQLARTRARYREWRGKVFERDDYTCQQCGARSGNATKVYLHAHHIKPFSQHKGLRYVVSNGFTLCDACHHTKHSHRF